jgi:hypothetical protein
VTARHAAAATVAVAAMVALTAGCGSGGAGTSTTGGATDPGQAPSPSQPADWRLGGTFTGAWPPTRQPPAVWAARKLPDFTYIPGYRTRNEIAFGPALHYAIPREGFDCQLGPSGSGDLPPGQYAVPFEVIVINRLSQQAPANPPASMTVTEDGGQQVPQITGEASSAMTNALDGCEGITLPANGITMFYGLIGPATAASLQHAVVHVRFANGGIYSGSGKVLRALDAPLAVLVPGRALPGR